MSCLPVCKYHLSLVAKVIKIDNQVSIRKQKSRDNQTKNDIAGLVVSNTKSIIINGTIEIQKTRKTLYVVLANMPEYRDGTW